MILGTRLYDLRQQLKDLAVSATEHFCRLGEIMKEIRDSELWKGEYDSFESFFSDPEFSFKKSSVYHSIRLVEVFPKWSELMDVPVSKLIMIVPYLEKNDQKELVSQARTLSTSDLYEELNELKATEKDIPYHPMPKTYPCNVCGKLKGIDFSDLCDCGWSFTQRKIISEAIEKVKKGINV